MRLFRWVLTVVCLIGSSPARADYISLIKADQCESIVEYFLDERGIRVTLEIGPEDFKNFREIVPTELDGELEKSLIEYNLIQFCTKNFPIQVDDHVLLPELRLLQVRDRILRSSLYTGKVDSTLELSPQILFVELWYPLNSQPEKIGITSPLDEEGELRPANIGMVFYHNGIPVNDLRYHSKDLEVTLNWEDPWYSEFNLPNYKRHHRSSMMSYLYIEPFEVRHEVIVRIKDLEEWIPFKYKMNEYIPIEDKDSLLKLISEFILDHNPLLIDGDTASLMIDKVNFLKVSLAGIQILGPEEELPYNAAIVGVIMSSPHQNIADSLALKWELFSEKIKIVPYVAIDPAGPMPGYLSTKYPEMYWENYLQNYEMPNVVGIVVEEQKIYAILAFTAISFLFFLLIFIIRRKNFWTTSILFLTSVVCVIFYFRKDLYHEWNIPNLEKRVFSIEESKTLVHQSLVNIYRAFDFRDESMIYDKLSLSLDGNILTDIYIKTKKSMVLEEQGGIEVQVDEVELLNLEETGFEGVERSYRCEWIIKGEVGHWGHKHRRNNRYMADLVLKAIDGSWKVVDIDILEEERIL